MLVARDAAVGLIEWEEAQLDWLTWDLAGAFGTFCAIDDNLDRAAAHRFVAAYCDAGGTAWPRADDLLIPLVRVKRILETLKAPTDRQPRWAHQRRNLRSLKHLAS